MLALDFNPVFEDEDEDDGEHERGCGILGDLLELIFTIVTTDFSINTPCAC